DSTLIRVSTMSGLSAYMGDTRFCHRGRYAPRPYGLTQFYPSPGGERSEAVRPSAPTSTTVGRRDERPPPPCQAWPRQSTDEPASCACLARTRSLSQRACSLGRQCERSVRCASPRLPDAPPPASDA